MFRLTDSQKVLLNVAAVSAAGNPAALENVKVTSSDETIVTVADMGEGKFELASTGKVGTSQITVDADARIGDGEVLLTGSETIEVIAGEAAQISLSFGEPESLVDPEPESDPADPDSN